MSSPKAGAENKNRDWSMIVHIPVTISGPNRFQ
jgi:hypothetical protein